MTERNEILVMDDEAIMLRLLKTILSAEGYYVHTVDNGTDAMALGLDPVIGLAILDVNLPDANGIDVARFLRSHSNLPILMLTSNADVGHRVAGLDAGADDYLSKPFAAEELCARVRSLLRRSSMTAPREADAEGLSATKDWRLDRQSMAVVPNDGAPIALTEREFMILTALMRRAGSVVTRDDLQRQVAGRQWSADDRSLDVHVSRLRKKLKTVTAADMPIKSVRGRGFRFEAE